ncbi:beta-phosphoglucomutase-like phosphatase (HAD superfamily) [Bradyrhizobium sp. i1.3.6]
MFTEDFELPKAAIFDLDGTLLDSVDLHALAWQEAIVKYGHEVTFEQIRSQIGKGGDKLIPVFLAEEQQREHGKHLEEWRGNRFKSAYLPLVRPFSAVPDLLRRVREAGLRIAVASSATKDELKKYLDIAAISDLVDVATSSEDVDESKPAPDIFEVVLKKLDIEGAEAGRDRRHAVRRRRSLQGRNPDHRRPLRRLHRKLAAGGGVRRRVRRTEHPLRTFRRHGARKVGR